MQFDPWPGTVGKDLMLPQLPLTPQLRYLISGLGIPYAARQTQKKKRQWGKNGLFSIHRLY